MQTNQIPGQIIAGVDPVAMVIPPKPQDSSGKSFAYHVEIMKMKEASESSEPSGDPDLAVAPEDAEVVVGDLPQDPTIQDGASLPDIDQDTMPVDPENQSGDGGDAFLLLARSQETAGVELRLNTGQARVLSGGVQGDMGASIVTGQPAGRPEPAVALNLDAAQYPEISTGNQTPPPENVLQSNVSGVSTSEMAAQNMRQTVGPSFGQAYPVPQTNGLGQPVGNRAQQADGGGDPNLSKASVEPVPSRTTLELANLTAGRYTAAVSGEEIPAGQTTDKELSSDKIRTPLGELTSKLATERAETKAQVDPQKSDLGAAESKPPPKPGSIPIPDGLAAASMRGPASLGAIDSAPAVPAQIAKTTPEIYPQTSMLTEAPKVDFATLSQTYTGTLADPEFFTAISDPRTPTASATVSGVAVAVSSGIPVQAGAMFNGAVVLPGVFAVPDAPLEDGNGGEFSALSMEQALLPGSARPGDSAVFPPGTARAVAVQLAEALITTQGSKVDIVLNPEELGRVRMVLSPSESGISVSITAERPETLELMRRHIDQLTEEFRALGYVDIGFEFSGEESDRNFDDGPNNQQTSIESEPESRPVNAQHGPESNPNTHPRVSCGLDMRL